MKSKFILSLLLIFVLAPLGASAEAGKKSYSTSSFSVSLDGAFVPVQQPQKGMSMLVFRYLKEKPKKGEVPFAVQLIILEPPMLGQLRKRDDSPAPIEIARGALIGITESHKERFEKVNGFLGKKEPVAYSVAGLKGFHQELKFNMFQGEGFEQLSDYYLLTDGDHFLHVQATYFPKYAEPARALLSDVMQSVTVKK